MGDLAAHHQAWLEAHPHRSERWLREALANGFDVHHIDGDKTNNEPSNLVLIEASDHAMLHGGRRLYRLVRDGKRWVRRKEGAPSKAAERTQRALAEAAALAPQAYMLAAKGLNWREVGEELEVSPWQKAMMLTRSYARRHDMTWPPTIAEAEARGADMGCGKKRKGRGK